MTQDRKQIHLNLYDEQIRDFEYALHATGITNANDLFRHLLRQFRLDSQQSARILVDAPGEYVTAQIPNGE